MLSYIRLLSLLLFVTFAFSANATRSIYDPVPIVTTGNMASSITSSACDLTYYDGFAIQAVYTGSPSGTFKIQVSADAGACTTFSDYTNSSQTISAAGDYIWIVNSSAYHCARLVYTLTSGSGTLNATCGRK